METTKNCGLKKPGQDDFYDVQDFDDNMETIDEHIGALESPTYEESKELEELESGESYLSVLGKIKKAVGALIAHIDDKQNPHGVTLAQLGAASANSLSAHIQNKSNPHGVTKAQVGLGNCDNTADNVKSVKNADTVDGKHFTDIQADAQARADKRLALTGGTISGDLVINANLSTSGKHGIYHFCLLRSNDELAIKSSGNDKNVNVFARLLNVVNMEATSNMDVQCLNLHYGGSLVHDSYRGAKENIHKADKDRIRRILDIPIEIFDYRPGFGNDKKDVVGMIVDEIQDIIPEAVEIPEDWNEETFDELLGSMGNKGIPGIDQTKLIPYIIGMQQIHNEQIEEITRRLDKLEENKKC